MTMNAFHRRASLLFALLPMLGACHKQDLAQDAAHRLEEARRGADEIGHALATLSPECTLGAPSQGPRGNWLTSSKAAGEPGHPFVYVYSFDTPATTHTVRIGLNRQALQTLEKVETRDARGAWSEAGPAARREAPAACEYVWLEQELTGAQQVEALRLSFRPGPGTIKAGDAGLLQDTTSQPGS
jgi:hypothetical protein